MTRYATDNNQTGDLSSTIDMLPVFHFFFDGQFRCGKKNKLVLNIMFPIFWICLVFFYLIRYCCFHVLFLGGRSLLRNVNCKPHWRAMQMTTTKLEFIKFDTQCSSESRKKYVEHYFSNAQTINFPLDRTHLQGPGRVVTFDLRECIPLF